jgi:hypothetical protein
MQLLRISKGRAALNAFICFVVGIFLNRLGAGLFGWPCIIVGVFFMLVIAMKFWNDLQRAMVGLTYQQTTDDYDEPAQSDNRTFGIYDPTEL